MLAGAPESAAPLEGLLHRQQQLGHHVPVDAAEPLIGEERARTGRVVPVVEQLLVDPLHAAVVGGHHGRGIGILSQPPQGQPHVVGIGETRGEMHPTSAVADDQAPAVGACQPLQQR